MKFIKKLIRSFQFYIKFRAMRKARKKHQEQYELAVMKNLVAEYNLIQEKKSNLSKSQREFVEQSIAALIASGKLKVNISQ